MDHHQLRFLILSVLQRNRQPLPRLRWDVRLGRSLSSHAPLAIDTLCLILSLVECFPYSGMTRAVLHPALLPVLLQNSFQRWFRRTSVVCGLRKWEATSHHLTCPTQISHLNLITWFRRLQAMHRVTTSVCLCSIWLPLLSASNYISVLVFLMTYWKWKRKAIQIQSRRKLPLIVTANAGRSEASACVRDKDIYHIVCCPGRGLRNLYTIVYWCKRSTNGTCPAIFRRITWLPITIVCPVSHTKIYSRLQS